jgi:hypothetical protein
MDERLRDLERRAHGGDAEALARLTHERRRAAGPAAARLLAFVGAPDDPPLRTSDLPPGWAAAPTWNGGSRDLAAEVRRALAQGSVFDVEYECRDAPPAAARGLLALLDELGAPPDHPARHLLVGRLALGLRRWGLEAFVRGVDATLRRACEPAGPEQAPAFAAVARWLDDPDEGAARAALDAGAALRPDFSPYFNFAPTGNTDAADEAEARWERERPVDAALCQLGRSVARDREHEDTARSLTRLRHVDARELERALRAAMWAWATRPDARVVEGG